VPTLRYGIIGWGRIGARIANRFVNTPNGPCLAAVLVRPARAAELQQQLPGMVVCTDLAAFVTAFPDIAVECASAEALGEFGADLLKAGIDLIPLSLAALADRDVEQRVLSAAQHGPGRIELSAGAMGSLEFLGAGNEGGLDRVIFRARNAPAVWRIRSARPLPELDGAIPDAPFLRGSVREIARTFPRSLNLSVGVALAGLGLDRTEAELYADSALTQARFEVDAIAQPGSVYLRVHTPPHPPAADPVDYTTFSVMHVLRRRMARIAI
jgi:aspartate dehydrogenase